MLGLKVDMVKLPTVVVSSRYCNVKLVSKLYGLKGTYKPGPHAAMLHTCDGVFQESCDA